MEFYGYKKCSTCRDAHNYLARHGVEVDFHDLVQSPPSVDQLASWVARRGEGVQPFINVKGISYRALGDEAQSWNEDAWLRALSADGKLLKRPILVRDDGIVLGFDRSVYAALVGDSPR